MAGFFNRGLYYQQIKNRVKKMISDNNLEEAQILCNKTLQELSGIVILTYHEIGHGKSQFITQPEVFKKQLQIIKELGYPVLSYDDLVKGWDFAKTGVIITFDDARLGIINYADSLLKEYNFPYTIFVTPGYLNNPDDIDENERFSQFLSWDDLGGLLNSDGVAIGAHSYTHRSMVDIESEEDLMFEIHDSKIEIEKQLSIKVTDFAYPYGRFTPEIEKKVIQDEYRTISTTLSGINTAETPHSKLKRSLVLQMFSEKEFTGIINPESIRNEFTYILQNLRIKK